MGTDNVLFLELIEQYFSTKGRPVMSFPRGDIHLEPQICRSQTRSLRCPGDLQAHCGQRSTS